MRQRRQEAGSLLRQKFNHKWTLACTGDQSTATYPRLLMHLMRRMISAFLATIAAMVCVCYEHRPLACLFVCIRWCVPLVICALTLMDDIAIKFSSLMGLQTFHHADGLRICSPVTWTVAPTTGLCKLHNRRNSRPKTIRKNILLRGSRCLFLLGVDYAIEG